MQHELKKIPHSDMCPWLLLSRMSFLRRNYSINFNFFSSAISCSSKPLHEIEIGKGQKSVANEFECVARWACSTAIVWHAPISLPFCYFAKYLGCCCFVFSRSTLPKWPSPHNSASASSQPSVDSASSKCNRRRAEAIAQQVEIIER